MSTAVNEKAKQIVAENIFGNVTLMVVDLMHTYDEDALLFWGGGDSDDYEAHEAWSVSPWLAGRLRSKEYRVEELGGSGQLLWARGASGQALYLDDVIQEIAEERLKSDSKRKE